MPAVPREQTVLTGTVAVCEVCLFLSLCLCRDLQGVLVTVDELGHLTCCYLGTDPSPFTAPPPSASRDLDFSQMEREVRELQKDIRTAEKGHQEHY